MPIATALAALLLLPTSPVHASDRAPAAAESPAHAPGTLTLPPSAAADQLAAPATQVVDVDLPHIPAWSDAAWNTPAPWELWSAALAAPSTPTNRATLAMVARAQGRYDALWDHLGALPPAWVQALAPALFAPTQHADGTWRLAPPLPPLPRHDPSGNTLPPKRLATYTDLAFGPTRADMLVEDTPEGVEITLEWKSGPPIDVAVTLPIPLDRRTRIMYFDWDKIDIAESYTVHLAPRPEQDDQTWVLWARCKPIWIAVPRLAAGQAPRNLPPMELCTTAEDPELERVRGFAGFLQATLGIEAAVLVDPGPFPDPRNTPDLKRTPLRMDFAPSEERMPRWLTIAAQIERTALLAADQAAGK